MHVNTYIPISTQSRGEGPPWGERCPSCPTAMSFDPATYYTDLIKRITAPAPSLRTTRCRSLAAIMSAPSAKTRVGEVAFARISLDRCPTTSVQMATCGITSLGSPGDSNRASSRFKLAKRTCAFGQTSPHILRMEGQPGKWDHLSPNSSPQPKGHCEFGPRNRPVVVQALLDDRIMALITTGGTEFRIE